MVKEDMNKQDKEEVSSQDKNNKKNKNKKNWIYIGIGIIVIIIILLLCLRSCGSENIDSPNNTVNPVFDLSEDENASEGGIEGKSQEEIQADLNEKVEDGMINISMNMAPVFENGTSEGNLLIVNEEINKYPQVVEIYLNDTEELIYKSGGVPVGSKIESGKLSVDLDKGVYECTAYFNAVNPDTNELVGKAGAQIELTVEN